MSIVGGYDLYAPAGTQGCGFVIVLFKPKYWWFHKYENSKTVTMVEKDGSYLNFQYKYSRSRKSIDLYSEKRKIMEVDEIER